MATEVIELR